MTGNWQCRTIKAGGISPLVVYDWFKCRVTDDGSGWMLEKISGSQRTKGRFFTDNDEAADLSRFFLHRRAKAEEIRQRCANRSGGLRLSERSERVAN